MTPLLPADFTQPSLQTILRINLDGTFTFCVDISLSANPSVDLTELQSHEKEQGIFQPCSYRSEYAIQFNKLEVNS